MLSHVSRGATKATKTFALVAQLQANINPFINFKLPPHGDDTGTKLITLIFVKRRLSENIELRGGAAHKLRTVRREHEFCSIYEQKHAQLYLNIQLARVFVFALLQS
jgi:hypothetical protein